MKDFLKFTFATVTGIVLSGIIFFFIGILFIFGMIASSDSETIVAKNSIMFLDLNGTLVERTEETNPFEHLLGDDFTNYGLDDILSSIKKAKENENIEGIYLQASSLNAAFASLEEIRNALNDFKQSGKFIVAYGDYYTQGLYYLSSVADKIILNPQGAIEWRGLSAQPMFYKDLLQKIGVEMQIFKVGTYKSAVEPFINTEMSDANREQVSAFLNSTWNKLVNDVSTSRGLPADSLNYIADNMLMFRPATESVSYGLADTLLYKDGVRGYLKQLLAIDESDDLNTLTLEEMINVKKNVPKDKSGNIIAVYYAYGEIDNMSNDGIVSKKVIKDLRKIREDDNVKALVFRVNSPGGSAFGSEQIWNEIMLMKREKPVIVSMGDYAASGGYYISCAADYIVAQPTTLTGSIGIFGMMPNVKGLTNKLGINFDVVKTNKYADIGAMGRGMTNDEKSLMQMNINNGYKLFTTRCADGRQMSTDAIERIAEGRVWTGETAKELGLVDELGGIDKALSIAAEKAGIENYTITAYPAKKDFLTSLMEKKTTGYIESKLQSTFGEYYESLSLIKNLKEVDFMQARLPFELNIK